MLKAIERLFERLGATYGAQWERSRGNTPEIDFKTAWCHELSGFKNSLHRLAWALENLPPKCPNVIEFKMLCRQAPSAKVEELPEPKADPKRMREELDKLGHLKTTEKPAHGMKDWAHRLKQRHDAGEVLNLNQVRCYKIALGAGMEPA